MIYSDDIEPEIAESPSDQPSRKQVIHPNDTDTDPRTVTNFHRLDTKVPSFTNLGWVKEYGNQHRNAKIILDREGNTHYHRHVRLGDYLDTGALPIISD